jgi:hypothetical protein
MKMQHKLTLAVVSGAVLFTATTPILAATHTPAKMTCAEFVSLDEVVKPKVVYWVQGFNKKGKPKSAFVDVEETDKLIPIIVTECQAAPKKKMKDVAKSIENRAQLSETTDVLENPVDKKK